MKNLLNLIRLIILKVLVWPTQILMILGPRQIWIGIGSKKRPFLQSYIAVVFIILACIIFGLFYHTDILKGSFLNTLNNYPIRSLVGILLVVLFIDTVKTATNINLDEQVDRRGLSKVSLIPYDPSESKIEPMYPKKS